LEYKLDRVLQSNKYLITTIMENTNSNQEFNRAQNEMNQAGTHAKHSVESYSQGAKDYITEMRNRNEEPTREGFFERAKESAQDAWEDTKHAAADAWDKTKDWATDAWDKTKDAAHDAKNQMKDTAHDVRNETQDKAHDLKNAAKDTAHDIRNNSNDTGL